MAQPVPTREELAQKPELNTREAFIYSGLSPSYLARMFRQGRIAASETEQGLIFDRASLDAYLTGDRKRGRRPQKKAAEGTATEGSTGE